MHLNQWPRFLSVAGQTDHLRIWTSLSFYTNTQGSVSCLGTGVSCNVQKNVILLVALPIHKRQNKQQKVEWSQANNAWSNGSQWKDPQLQIRSQRAVVWVTLWKPSLSLEWVNNCWWGHHVPWWTKWKMFKPPVALLNYTLLLSRWNRCVCVCVCVCVYVCS